MVWRREMYEGPPIDFGKEIMPYIKRFFLPAIIVVILLIAGLTSCFTVKANEEAAILRFGRYIETVGPGLHFKLPFGIDKSIIVETKTVHEEEFGFRTIKAGRVSEFDYDFPGAKEVSLMLTADQNCAEVNWVVRYRIKDLKEYLFNVRDVKDTIRDVSEAVMRRIVGDSSIDEVLMSRRKEIEDMAVEEIEGFLERYGCGIHIVEVNLMRVDPPTAVKAAFDAVNQAKQVRDQIINEAEAKKNRELIPAEGKKERMIAEANGYRRERINKAQGDAKAFLAILEEYQKAKEITRRRLYLETLGRILPRCGKLYLIDKEQKGLLPILTLPERTGGSAR